MKYQDYYAILGVPRDADAIAIKKAYRLLARKHHPDVAKTSNSKDSEETFKQAALAYATLKDPEKRAAYDALGRRAQGEEFVPPHPWKTANDGHATEGYPAGMNSDFDFEGMDLSDLMAAFGRSQPQTAAQNPSHFKGRDYDHRVEISLENALHGSQLNLHVEGSNHADDRSLQVSVPAGVRAGQKLRLRGKGGKGRVDSQGFQGADGDMYLHITLAPHPIFRPDHSDLYFDLALSPWEAALGGDVEVPTLDGPVLLTVPAGSSSGRRLRLRGRGLPQGEKGALAPRGDIYAVVGIFVPGQLSQRERELFEQLATCSHYTPRKTAGTDSRSPSGVQAPQQEASA